MASSSSQSTIPWEPPDEKWKRNLRLRIQQSLAPQVADAKRAHASALAEVDEEDFVTRTALNAQHEEAMDAIRRKAQDEFDHHLQGEILQRRYVADHKLDSAEWAMLQRYQQTLFDHVARGSPERERARTVSNEPRPGSGLGAVSMVRTSSAGTSAAGSAPREPAAGVLLRPMAAEAPEPGRRRNNSVASTSSLENQLWSTTRKRAGSSSAGSGPSGAIRIPEGPLERERWTPLTPPDEPVPRASRASPASTPDSDIIVSRRSKTRVTSRGRSWRSSLSPGPEPRTQASRTMANALVDVNLVVPSHGSAPTSEPEDLLSDTPAADVETWSDVRRGKRSSRSHKSRTGTRTAPGSPSMLSPTLLNPPQPSPSQSVTLLEARGTPTGSPNPFQPIDLAPPLHPVPSRPPAQSAPPSTSTRRSTGGSIRRPGRASELGLVEMPPSTQAQGPPFGDIVSPSAPMPAPTISRLLGEMGPPAFPSARSVSQFPSNIATSKPLNGKRSFSDIPVSAPARPISFDSNPINGSSPANPSPIHQLQDGRRPGALSSSPNSAGGSNTFESTGPYGPGSSKFRRGSSSSIQAADEPVVPPSATSVRFRRGSSSSINSPAPGDEPGPGTSAPRGMPILRPRRSANLRDEFDGAGPSPRTRAWFGPEPIPEDERLELPPQLPEQSPRDRDGVPSMSRNGSLRSRSSRDYLRNFTPDLYGFAGPAGQRRSGPFEDGSEEDDWQERRSMSIRSVDMEEIFRRDAEAAKKEEELKAKEEEAKAREEELEAAKQEFAKREKEVKRMEAEVRRLEEEVCKQADEMRRQAADVAKKEEDLIKKEQTVKKELEEVRREKEEARRKEEEARRREDDARREREDARTKEAEARRTADEARITAQEARKTSEEARRKEEAAKRKEEMAKRKEEAAKKKEVELKRKEEEAQRQMKRAEEEAQKQVEAALREAQRREEEVRKREEELARREQDLARRELLQRKEKELFEREQLLRSREEEQRQQTRQKEDEERARRQQSAPVLEEAIQVGDESLIDDEPLLAPPPLASLSAPILSTQVSTFEALLEPTTPIDRASTETPLADDERSPVFKKRGTAKARKREEKLRRATEEDRQQRETEERRRREEEEERRLAEEAEQLRLEEENRRQQEEEEARLREEEERRMEEEEARLLAEEEERAREAEEQVRLMEEAEEREHLDREARRRFEAEEAERIHLDDEGAEAQRHLEEDIQLQRAMEDEAQMLYEERRRQRSLQDQEHRENLFRRQQREEQLRDDERYAKQLMEEQERERQGEIERQRKQRHVDVMRRAQEEGHAFEEGFRRAQEAERKKWEEDAARQASQLAERKRREEQQRLQREEDERRRGEWRRPEAASSYPAPPTTSASTSVPQSAPRTDAIPIPANRTSSSSSNWSAGGTSTTGWTSSTRPTSTSTATSSRPTYPATGTSPSSNQFRGPGTSGQSPGTGSYNSSSTARGAPLSEAEWARRQAEQARKQQEQYKRDQERAAREKQSGASRAYTKEDVAILFQKHQDQWEIIRNAHKVGWGSFPWPVFRKPNSPEDLTTDAIAAYVLSPYYPAEPSKTQKDRIKEHIRRWHPDRFDTQLLPKVNEEEREMVKEGAGWVVRALSELLTRTNTPGLFD